MIQQKEALKLSYRTDRKYSEEDLLEIIELYQEYHFSLELIGSFFGVSNVPIKRILKDLKKYYRVFPETKENHKICIKCGIEKHIELFNRSRGYLSGRDSRCVSCMRNSKRKGRSPTIPENEAGCIVSDYENTDASINTLSNKYGYHLKQLKNFIRNKLCLVNYQPFGICSAKDKK